MESQDGQPDWQQISELLGQLMEMLTVRGRLSEEEKLLISDTFHEKCYQVRSGRAVPPSIARGFAELAACLADVTVTLKSGPVVGGGVLALLVCDCLSATLPLLRCGALELVEGDWVRLLTAAAAPLECVLPQLQHLAAAVSGPSPSRTAPDSLDKCLSACGLPIVWLTGLAAVEPPVMPPRVAAVLAATVLTPQKLLPFVSTLSQASLAWMVAEGHHTPSASTVTALWSLFTTGTCSGLHTALERRPVVQQQVLRWCARGIVMPESEQDAAVQDCDRCTCLRCMVEVLASSDSLIAATHQHEAAASHTSLLAAAGALAAHPHLQAARDGREQAALLLACLSLHARLGRAVCQLAMQQGLPGADMAALLQQLGGPGGLPLLCQLAGEVAAAAATAAQDSTAAGAAQSSSSFGAQCWGALGQPWVSVLVDWAQYGGALANDHSDGSLAPSLCVPDSCAAACRAAEALLRLAPLLASQPAQETDSFGASWRSMGALVAAAGGADALLMSRSDGLDTEALCVALAMLLPKVVASLLFISDWEAAASPGNALASFHALLSACQLTHTMEPHLRPSSTAAAGSGGAAAGAPAAGSCAAAPDPSPAGGQAPIVFESTAVSLGCCLSQSTMHTYALSHTMMGRLPANEQGPYARRLECCLLLFLGTLSALPLPPGTVQSGVDRKRCVMLNVLLKAEEQALASLWRLLLGTASAAAAGMDTLSLLAEVACRGLRGLCAPGGGGANLDDWDAPLYMLNLVANVEPAVLPRLVKLRALMRMLCASGAALAEAASWQAPQGKTHYRCLLLLLRQLAPHLQVDPSKRGDVRLCVEGLASEDGQRRRQALPLFASLVGEQQEEQPAAGDGASPRRQPLGPEGEQLAVRRARALAVLKCANPRCSRLAGASEAAAPRGRLCSGCRTVRFCSEACSRQEWPQHRAACRLLRAASHNG